MILNKIKSKKGDLFGIFVLIVVVFLPAILIKFLWGWIVLDIFPGAVEQGLITDSLTWGTTLKLAIAFFIMNMMSYGNSKSSRR